MKPDSARPANPKELFPRTGMAGRGSLNQSQRTNAYMEAAPKASTQNNEAEFSEEARI
jgi:hypothetical protein